MDIYHYRNSNVPGVVIGHGPSAASYEVDFRTYLCTRWGGVVHLSVAKDLRPWSQAVPLAFDGYKVGAGAWIDIEEGERLWGCLLQGPKNLAVLFGLIENDWPVVRRSIFGAKK